MKGIFSNKEKNRTCSHCGARINMNLENETLFCPQCGQKISNDFNQNNSKKETYVVGKIIGAVTIIAFAVIIFLIVTRAVPIKREEKRLEELYDEAWYDMVMNNDYESAWFKANSLVFTLDNDKKKKEWNEKRSFLLKTIQEEAKDKLNGDTIIRDGIYDIFEGPIHPSEEYVISKLETIEDITGIEAVTEANDYNHQLGKTGGYSAGVYFTLVSVNENDIPVEKRRKGIVDTGTVGGGCIEVFENFDDAVSRCNYLDSIRAISIQGQREAIVGTSVIRLSQYLTATEQQEILDKIVKSLQEE